MTATVSKSNDTSFLTGQDRVAATKLSSASGLMRKNRWKRRGKRRWLRTFSILTIFLSIGIVAGLAFWPKGANIQQGLETPFAKAVFEAFPEANPEKIVTMHNDGLPWTATLHLPAYLIEPGQGIGNPFARLGVEFGGVERTLSGTEMASRLEQIGQAVLPTDLVRCHSYEIGEISSAPESPRRTRVLYLHLNPGC